MTGHVLVVDDSLTVRMDLAEAFEAAGFSVTLCCDLTSARAATAGVSFDLVVLDVLLPDGDGLEFLRNWKAAPATADRPVMLLSTEGEVRDRILGLRTGADEYVGKPYDSVHVVSRARELILPRQRRPARDGQVVLVVDVASAWRDRLQMTCEGEGLRIVTASTGDEGLRAAALVRPDAIVVSGTLPDEAGARIVRKLRLDAAVRRTPCVLLTTAAGRDEELAALEAGADAFASKQEDLGMVLARLRALLRSSAPPTTFETTASLLAPHRVLAVDDSPTWLDVLAEQLRRDGYDVVQAASGEQALDLLAVQTVDCILLDLVMPGLSGHETCQRIKQTPTWRDIPLILLSAVDERSAMIDGMNFGADDYIAKSGDFDVLKARLRAQIRRRQFEDENRQIREQLLRREMEVAEAESARCLAETRAALMADLEAKNKELADINLALEQARDQAERESQFKSRFLASMSHELRTPLNAVIGFSELLSDETFGPLQEQQREYVQNVLQSGVHLLNLINDILDLSKIEAGRMELHCAWTPVFEVVQGVLATARTLADKRGVRLAIEVAEGLPHLYVDPMRVRQVLLNLLSNAIKFTPPGNGVALRVSMDADALLTAVADDGIGIRSEDIGRLFNEFEQLSTGYSDKPDGTGLGLVLTRRLVAMHGGTVGVTSQPGIGSVFTVRWPLLRTVPGEPYADVGPDEPLAWLLTSDPGRADRLAEHLRTCGLAVRMLRPDAPRAFDLSPGVVVAVVLAGPRDEPARLVASVRQHLADTPILAVEADGGPGGAAGPRLAWLEGHADRPKVAAALAQLGVAHACLEGRTVAVVGPHGAARTRVDATLRAAGCRSRVADHVPTEAADVVLADAGELATWQGPPLRVVPVRRDDGQPSVPGALTWTDALRPERLTRVVAAALANGGP